MSEQEATHPIGEDEQRRYADLLSQVKARLNAAGDLLGQPVTVFTVEHAALQLRKVIELVALGSLVTNRSHIEAVRSAFHKAKWDDARKVVRQVNPNYWPEPTRQEQRAPGFYETPDVSDPYLTEDQAGREWGWLSERLLHATNPYQPQPDLVDAYARLHEIHARLVTLLTHHRLRLADTDFMAIGVLHTSEGGVQVALFERAEPPPTDESGQGAA